jgi:hypothetical protein
VECAGVLGQNLVQVIKHTDNGANNQPSVQQNYILYYQGFFVRIVAHVFGPPVYFISKSIGPDF